MDNKNHIYPFLQTIWSPSYKKPTSKLETAQKDLHHYQKNMKFPGSKHQLDGFNIDLSFKTPEKDERTKGHFEKKQIVKKKVIRRKARKPSSESIYPKNNLKSHLGQSQYSYRNQKKLLRKKSCLICRSNNSLQDLIVCATCEDAYHQSCLKLPVHVNQSKSFNQWFCYQCLMYESYSPSNLITYSLLQKPSIFLNGQTYLNYMKDQIELFISQREYVKLDNLPEQYWTKRQPYGLGLKSFKPFEIESQYFESLALALSSARLLFYPHQLYKSRQILELNRSIMNQPQAAYSLNMKDQQQFQKFLENISKGYAPPLRVQHCETKGYYLRALQNIPTQTIICEYSGEVVTYRQALRQFKNNSIFTLLQTGEANKTLVIVPNRFANISKYFLGINNTIKKSYMRINVQSLLFSYRGRNRIIFYSLRQIQKEEILYIDYNAGLCDRYPTSDFK